MPDPDWLSQTPAFNYRSPTPADIKKYFGPHLIKSFCNDFEIACWDSPQFAQSMLHCIIGQMDGIRDRYIQIGSNQMDQRIHLLLLQISGSGKSQGFRYGAEIIGHGLKQKITQPARISTAKMVGSVKTVKGPKGPEEQRIIGTLDPQSHNRFLMQDEGTLIFENTSKDAKEMITFYQKLMDPIGNNTIENDNLLIGDTPISIQPSLSLSLTSYFPTNLPKLLQTGGFWPRTFLLPNTKEFDTFEDDIAKICNSFFYAPQPDHQMDTRNIVEALKAVQYHYSTLRTKPITYSTRLGTHQNPINMTDTHLATIKQNNAIFINASKTILSSMTNLDPMMKDVMRTFATRKIIQMVIIAHHHCALRFGWQITEGDILYAKNLIQSPWKRLIEYAEDNQSLILSETKQWMGFKKMLDSAYHKLRLRQPKAKGWIEEKAIIDLLILTPGWGTRSTSTTRNRINKIISLGHYNKEKVALKSNPDKKKTCLKEIT